jgi:hypothetical protein
VGSVDDFSGCNEQNRRGMSATASVLILIRVSQWGSDEDGGWSGEDDAGMQPGAQSDDDGGSQDDDDAAMVRARCLELGGLALVVCVRAVLVSSFLACGNGGAGGLLIYPRNLNHSTVCQVTLMWLHSLENTANEPQERADAALRAAEVAAARDAAAEQVCLIMMPY